MLLVRVRLKEMQPDAGPIVAQLTDSDVQVAEQPVAHLQRRGLWRVRGIDALGHGVCVHEQLRPETCAKARKRAAARTPAGGEEVVELPSDADLLCPLLHCGHLLHEIGIVCRKQQTSVVAQTLSLGESELKKRFGSVLTLLVA